MASKKVNNDVCAKHIDDAVGGQDLKTDEALTKVFIPIFIPILVGLIAAVFLLEDAKRYSVALLISYVLFMTLFLLYYYVMGVWTGRLIRSIRLLLRIIYWIISLAVIVCAFRWFSYLSINHNEIKFNVPLKMLYESDHSDFQYVYREGPLQAHTTIDPITLAPNTTLFMACSERIMRACKV